MNNPEHMTREQLIKLAKCHKSMIANLQNQLRKALESNARLYAESNNKANQDNCFAWSDPESAPYDQLLLVVVGCHHMIGMRNSSDVPIGWRHAEATVRFFEPNRGVRYWMPLPPLPNDKCGATE